MLRTGELSVHEFVVEEVIDYLQNRGFTEITANLPGFPQPEKVVSRNKRTSFIPDIIAERQGDTYIFAVETGEVSLEGSLSRKWKEFAFYAESNGMIFHIVVPKGMLKKVDCILSSLGITAVVHQVDQ
ncbi:MAG: hypothetical protein HF314_15805 [Ignavibacteria bacterium]|jgi:hypothetical protein|nr:hypothetical protein [Ignavibacteria bacterium]MCU7504545.1 hypothetical protein [Ignavibacteria bacterium]MCU7516617.1 hypothetical protein [Ignavibacteria bacterium]